MEKEKKRAPRAKFYVEQQHWAVQTAIIFMALSAVFRIVGCYRIVLRNAIASSIIVSDIELRFGISLLCRLEIPISRRRRREHDLK